VKHPEALLEYALGTLADAEERAVASHLDGCASCRAEIRRLREGLAVAVGELPTAPLDPGLRNRVLARVEPQLAAARAATARRRAVRRWNPGAWVGAVAGVMAVLAGTVAYQQWQAHQRTEQERAVVAAWLTRDDVTTHRLPATDPGGRSVGSVMVADDGVVLVVLRSLPPSGHTYQVWGHGETGPSTLALTAGTVARVDASGWREVGVSIEPSGGSPAPTAPLGSVPVVMGP
jgi:anti-sigma-K factor RskA